MKNVNKFRANTQGLINFEPTDAQRHNAETTLAQSRLNVVWVYRKVILGKDYEDSVRRTTIMKKKQKKQKNT